ncbi:internal virion protein A / acetyltransferase [Pseudomonas phage Waldo5]|uniref:Internal virion protein A / acetyltransferase n=1 Tax=Pseudomonas phage Waldo5 TaxID=2762290 RepID=A0A7G8LJQ2_9CAUD|nr:internal virion protein A / acetyltransferase [Pseudomonas phage Waldo5]
MFLTQATKRDLEEAASNLSFNDLCEFHSNIRGRDPAVVLPACLDETTMVIKVGALVLAVGGSKQCLWFVTTTVVDQLTKGQRIRFYKLLHGHLKGLRESGHPYLTNFVSVDNWDHIRLLDALGAKYAKEHTMSPAGCRFRQFWL